MEFTTPPSYNSTTVNVGCITKGDEILYAGATNSVTHTESTHDEENEWPEPKSIKWVWEGKTPDEKDFHAEIDGSVGPRLDRIDVMAEVPAFFKAIAGSVAGTKPYIYQVSYISLVDNDIMLILCSVFAEREASIEAQDWGLGVPRGWMDVCRSDVYFIRSKKNKKFSKKP